MKKSKIVPIKGMHCKACTIVVSDELGKIKGVKHASANLKSANATIVYEGDTPTDASIEKAVKAAGYTVGLEQKSIFSRDGSVYKNFIYSLAIIFFAYIGLKLLGFNGIGVGNVTNDVGLMALLLGLTAGFSTCMALVGGLVLGLSARYAEKHQTATTKQRFTPHLFFNLGRIVLFTALGGLIGLFGSAIKINSSFTGLVAIVIGFVMLVIGLQLTEIFPRLAGKGLTLPTGLAKALGLKGRREKEYSHKNAFILGGLSFFLPCGFTQSMQLAAIASGDFVTGAIMMGLFAVGTSPGLLGVGGLTAIVEGDFAKKFFRFAGVLVIIFAGYNIINGFNLTGYKLSLPEWKNNAQSVEIDKNATYLRTTFRYSENNQDITPSVFNVEVGKSYVLEVDAKDNGQGCMSTIMIPGLYDTPLLIRKGLLRLPFVAEEEREYSITCAMGLQRGTIIATKAEAK